MSSPTDRTSGARGLRILAVVLVVVVQGGCAASLHVFRTLVALDRQARPSREARHAELAGADAPPAMFFPSLVGTLEAYGDGTVDVLTVIERRRVRVDGLTSIFTPTARAGLKDLRPGAVLAILGETNAAGETVADVIVVRPPS